MFEERPRPKRKMPVRTILLMVIALLAFARMWWVMVERPARNAREAAEQEPTVIEVTPRAAPVEVRDAGGGH